MIQILTSDLINKIAAGEVIERPASILRELIDNSIDAKSTKIEIYSEEAGMRNLTVIDNGHGMNKDDLKLSILRHATSKIKTEDDLFSIYTLGFRGEAIPSIASVSKFEISSRTKDDELGYQIIIHGGEIIEEKYIAMNVGTKVTIKELFFNTPVRKKFLKKEETEFSYIYDTFLKYVLYYNNISFDLYKNNKKIKFFPVQTLKERVFEVFGVEIAQNLFPVSIEFEYYKIVGFIGNPEMCYKNNSHLHIFINGRFIKDKVVLHAISEGYSSILDSSLYPFVVLFIKVDPKHIDINVHPQKSEVRFSDGRKIHLVTVKVISDALATTPWVKRDLVFSNNSSNLNTANTFTKVNDFVKNTNDEIILNSSLADNKPQLLESDYYYKSPNKNIFTFQPQQISFDNKKDGYFANLKVVGQLLNTYIVCEDSEGMIIVDQHAAHERIGYECLLNGYKNKNIQTENLLIPIIINLSPEKMAAFGENSMFFETIGFDIEIFSETSIVIRKIPLIFHKSNVEKLIKEIVDDYFSSGFSMQYEDKLKEIYSSMACHSVTRGGDKLNEFEMKSLLEKMDTIDFAANCPHGRPVYFKMTKYELEKKFLRV